MLWLCVCLEKWKCQLLSPVWLFETPWTPLSPWFLCQWDSPAKNTGVGCHSFLQEIFPTQGSNPGLPPCRQILYYLSTREGPCLGREIKMPCASSVDKAPKWSFWWFLPTPHHPHSSSSLTYPNTHNDSLKNPLQL